MIEGEGREAGNRGGEGIGQATGQREWKKAKDRYQSKHDRRREEEKGMCRREMERTMKTRKE